jgi:hypothetical protein
MAVKKRRRSLKAGRQYDVIVGNVGMVYSGSSRSEAARTFNEYMRISRSGHGRAGSEPVTLMQDGEIVRELHPRHHRTR